MRPPRAHGARGCTAVRSTMRPASDGGHACAYTVQDAARCELGPGRAPDRSAFDDREASTRVTSASRQAPTCARCWLACLVTCAPARTAGHVLAAVDHRPLQRRDRGDVTVAGRHSISWPAGHVGWTEHGRRLRRALADRADPPVLEHLGAQLQPQRRRSSAVDLDRCPGRAWPAAPGPTPSSKSTGVGRRPGLARRRGRGAVVAWTTRRVHRGRARSAYRLYEGPRRPGERRPGRRRCGSTSR